MHEARQTAGGYFIQLPQPFCKNTLSKKGAYNTFRIKKPIR
jgi:hypothetical protein